VRSLALLVPCLALAAAAPLVARGQSPAPQQPALRDTRPFESGVDITTITATVTDKEGHPLVDLTRDQFEVYEDGVKQTVTQFTHERMPIGLGVLIDISDSMFGKRIQDARAAVDRFLFTLLDPADEFFLASFNHRAHILTGWTRDQKDVQRALDGLKPTGGTAIYDAILEAMPVIERRTRPRAALLVISDGADTASTATLRDIRSALLRSDAFVYAIAIDSPERQPINTRVNVQTLREITAESGGRTEVVRNSADLDEAAARIADELNSQYVLAYTPPRAADGQFHSIRVRIAGTDDRVRARNGYIATPNQRRRSD
jgi:Ca-activated chloride channel homolog